jgi:hypothetical protein
MAAARRSAGPVRSSMGPTPAESTRLLELRTARGSRAARSSRRSGSSRIWTWTGTTGRSPDGSAANDWAHEHELGSGPPGATSTTCVPVDLRPRGHGQRLALLISVVAAIAGRPPRRGPRGRWEPDRRSASGPASCRACGPQRPSSRVDGRRSRTRSGSCSPSAAAASSRRVSATAATSSRTSSPGHQPAPSRDPFGRTSAYADRRRQITFASARSTMRPARRRLDDLARSFRPPGRTVRAAGAVVGRQAEVGERELLHDLDLGPIAGVA